MSFKLDRHDSIGNVCLTWIELTGCSFSHVHTRIFIHTICPCLILTDDGSRSRVHTFTLLSNVFAGKVVRGRWCQGRDKWKRMAPFSKERERMWGGRLRRKLRAGVFSQSNHSLISLPLFWFRPNRQLQSSAVLCYLPFQVLARLFEHWTELGELFAQT